MNLEMNILELGVGYMNTYVFNLDDYFEYTQKYYYFFDGLIAFEKKLKKDVLKEVDIYDVSYR